MQLPMEKRKVGDAGRTDGQMHGDRYNLLYFLGQFVILLYQLVSAMYQES